MIIESRLRCVRSCTYTILAAVLKSALYASMLSMSCNTWTQVVVKVGGLNKRRKIRT